MEPEGELRGQYRDPEGNERGDLARKFRHFALCESQGASPLYETLSLRIAEDDDLLALAAVRTPPHPAPNLLFAAVHALLLRGEEHPLAAFYPTVTARPSPVRDPFPAFRAFCLDHREELERLVSTRRVQTNEVGRSALLLTGLGELLREHGGGPVALIDLGASAGLNLGLDRYGYEFRGPGDEARTWRGAAARPGGVELQVEVRGTRQPPLPGEGLRVVARTGIDPAPVDLTDPEDELWLRALVWPDQVGGRMQRLMRAIEVTREAPPCVHPGTAAEWIEPAVRAAPQDAHVVVTHTATLYLLAPAERDELESQLCELSRERPIARIGMEWIGGVETALSLTRYAGGRAEHRHLAGCHPHGAWIDWATR